MKTVLVIVDMQPKFTAANDEATIAGCAEQIKQAIDQSVPIVFLEYATFGETNQLLKDLVTDYPYAFFKTKSENDGSDQVKEILDENSIADPYKFIICGVNAEACVYQTVKGLLYLYTKSNIWVERNAVNGYSSSKDYQFHSLENESANVPRLQVTNPTDDVAIEQMISEGCKIAA